MANLFRKITFIIFACGKILDLITMLYIIDFLKDY